MARRGSFVFKQLASAGCFFWPNSVYLVVFKI